jgi:glycosyltransferase involved in cell wall biosynthesis
MRTLMVNRMIGGAAAIHCTSEGEKRAVDGLSLTTRTVVIPLGIDQDWFDQSPIAASDRHRDPYVLVMSRLHPKKNLEPLIESFAEVSSASGTAWRLVIAGSGDAEYVARLEQMVQRLRATDRVTFAGWMDGEKKREIIRRASLFALVSLHENFGVSLLEALALGVPGLVSRHVDLAEAVERASAGWVVDTDSRSLTAGLADAMNHPEERDARGWSATTLARDYTWPGIAGQLRELYNQLTAPVGALMPASMCDGSLSS